MAELDDAILRSWGAAGELRERMLEAVRERAAVRAQNRALRASLNDWQPVAMLLLTCVGALVLVMAALGSAR